MKRIMLDMSATIIHHGHTRLINKAAEHGEVIIGLTTDDEIISCKGFTPELDFESRKEILLNFKAVSDVVAVPWLLTDETLAQHNIDLLVHGSDNSNEISEDKLLVLPRTEGVSSTEIRHNAMRSTTDINNKKLMLTPGPAAVLYDNVKEVKPLFGRGDDEFTEMASAVTEWVKGLSGQDHVVFAQGSSTFALELAAHSFVSGNILLVSTGYYSDRLEILLPKECSVTKCNHTEIDSIQGDFDWVLCAYTETSVAIKLDIEGVRQKANELSAKLYVDATGSIGLEDKHELADVMAFSSCKGLLGITGACFVAYKDGLTPKDTGNFYFNLNTQDKKMVTGPYHAIASLYGVMPNHSKYVQRVRNSKEAVLNKWPDLIKSDVSQPLLCTYLEAEVVPNDDNIVLYAPRSELPGSVICHFGELHHDATQIIDRISMKDIS